MWRCSLFLSDSVWGSILPFVRDPGFQYMTVWPASFRAGLQSVLCHFLVEHLFSAAMRIWVTSLSSEASFNCSVSVNELLLASFIS